MQLFNIPGLWLDNAVMFMVSIPRLKIMRYFIRLPLTSSCQQCSNTHDYIWMEIWIFHGINCRFNGVIFTNSTVGITWNCYCYFSWLPLMSSCQ
jgi:hypothetical protein